MRRSAPVLVLIAAITVTVLPPASAQSGCERDGSTLVLRSGSSNELTVAVGPEQVNGCAASGLSGVRVLGSDGPENLTINFAGSELPVRVQAGGGDDVVSANDDTAANPKPVQGTGVLEVLGERGTDRFSGDVRRLAIDLGDGDDEAIGVTAREAMAVAGGPGADELTASGSGSGSGPWLLDGGDGNDRIEAATEQDWRVLGGTGDDRISAVQGSVSCGPGADHSTGTARYDATCPPNLLLSGRLVATYARTPRTLRLPAFRLNRRATIVFSVATSPPGGRSPVAVIPRTSRTVGPGTVSLAIVMTREARKLLRPRRDVRGALTVSTIRNPGATGGDTGGNFTSRVRLRRR